MQANQQKYRFINNEQGFSLIEILIALAIFSFGILAVAQLQLGNVRNNTNGNAVTMATLLARQQMEILKSETNLTDLDASPGADPNNPITADGNPGGIFTLTWDVDPGVSSTSRALEVRVSWTRQGGSRSVVLTSITRGN